ncbi:MAG: MFS transporter, partial [Mycetocola sp.]
ILSGNLITKTGRYRMFPILGTLITAAAMVAFTTLTADTPIWLICVFLFVFGAGLGLIMQVVVLVAQNSVDASEVGTATSTNNYFREVGASLGVAVFGTIFTSRLTTNLTEVFAGAGANAGEASQAASTIDPQTLNQLPEAVRDGVVAAYADALAPVFWYLLPFIGLAFLLSLLLKQIPLSDVAGLVARGEAVGGAEAEALEAEARGTATVQAGAGGEGAVPSDTDPSGAAQPGVTDGIGPSSPSRTE